MEENSAKEFSAKFGDQTLGVLSGRVAKSPKVKITKRLCRLLSEFDRLIYAARCGRWFSPM
jgi:hypothetical protein